MILPTLNKNWENSHFSPIKWVIEETVKVLTYELAAVGNKWLEHKRSLLGIGRIAAAVGKGKPVFAVADTDWVPKWQCKFAMVG